MNTDELRCALALRDLTDPAEGPHAMQLLLDEVVAAVGAPVWLFARQPHRQHR
jgi:phenylalanyl-tRNA synthetase alpha chain